jgi:hypothetical protein
LFRVGAPCIHDTSPNFWYTTHDSVSKISPKSQEERKRTSLFPMSQRRLPP